MSAEDRAPLDTHLRELHEQLTPWQHFTYSRDGQPVLYLSIRPWTVMADVVAVRVDCETPQGVAYRTPAPGPEDVLTPILVTGLFAGNSNWAIRNIITRPMPGDPSEHVFAQPAPAICGDIAQITIDLRPPIKVNAE